jgi:hypothetical protein
MTARYPVLTRISRRRRKTPRRAAARRDGAAAVEAAIVLPVFLLIIIAMFDLGLAVFHYNTLGAAAKRGARQAIVHGASAAPQMNAWGPASYSGAASDSSEIARAIQPRLFSFDPASVQLQADWIDGGNQPDQRVRVTLSYQQRAIVPSLLGYPPLQLRAVSTMRILH